MNWWEYVILVWGAVTSIGWGVLAWAALTAPLDTELWPGGEPE